MKRNALLSLLLLAISVHVACATSGDQAARNVAAPAAAPSSPASSASPAPPAAPLPADAPPISTAHGDGGFAPAAAPAASSSGTSAKPEMDTAALDAKIKQAEARAKASGAGEADRRAAAEAYFERGYKYYTAQQPALYKFALGDFRRVLRYQPTHAEAKEIINQIESIYRSMGRPVPTNGLEP